MGGKGLWFRFIHWRNFMKAINLIIWVMCNGAFTWKRGALSVSLSRIFRCLNFIFRWISVKSYAEKARRVWIFRDLILFGQGLPGCRAGRVPLWIIWDLVYEYLFWISAYFGLGRNLGLQDSTILILGIRPVLSSCCIFLLGKLRAHTRLTLGLQAGSFGFDSLLYHQEFEIWLVLFSFTK